MLSDFLLEVLLLRQGPRISEDAMILFKLRNTHGGAVISWQDFVEFEAKPYNYIFKKDVQKRFIASLNAQLAVIDRLKLDLKINEFNNEVCFRHERSLKAVKTTLEGRVPDENLFVEKWLKNGVYISECAAWKLYICRLGECLQKANEIKAGAHEPYDEDAALELGSLLGDVFSVNHYMHAPSQ